MFPLPHPGFPVSEGHVCISLPGHAFPRRDRDVGYRAHIHAAPQRLQHGFMAGYIILQRLIHRIGLFSN